MQMFILMDGVLADGRDTRGRDPFTDPTRPPGAQTRPALRGKIEQPKRTPGDSVESPG